MRVEPRTIGDTYFKGNEEEYMCCCSENIFSEIASDKKGGKWKSTDIRIRVALSWLGTDFANRNRAPRHHFSPFREFQVHAWYY